MCRKLIYLTFFVLVLSVAGNASADLILHWMFDEGSGTTVNDSSGNGHVGTIEGATWTVGEKGPCLEFGGDGDRVVDENGADYLNGMEALTVCMWIKSDLTNTDKGFLQGKDPDESDNVFTMRYDASGVSFGGTNIIKMALTSTPDGEQQLESSSNIQVTEWQHVAMTWSSGDLIRFYINGVEDTPSGRNGPNNAGPQSGVVKLIIGQGAKDSGGGWDGMIDDVRIYNIALSDAEIQALGAPSKASAPSPADGATDVTQTPTLRWTAGDRTFQHYVYFGTDEEAVRNANMRSPEYKDTKDLGSESYEPGKLEWNTTYYWRVDEYNTDETISEGRVWSFTVVVMVDPLAEALDTDLSFTTGGSADWFSQTATSYYDGDAAQSGDISDEQDSWMQTTVSGTGTVKFYWKVSSEEDFDFLEFYIDGSLQSRISGSVDWQQKTYTITTSGSHTLEWRYVKDDSNDSGSDTAWIDYIVFPVGGTTELAGIPFSRGVNLTGWLQKSSVGQIQFTKFTKQDFINIKSLGCDVIRLPIKLHYMTNGEPDYTIDPLFYYFLDQIIDWAEELELHLILDNHSSNEPTDPSIGDILVPLWMQMAEHYKDRSTYIYYEVFNEPYEISDATWNQIQKEVIDAIRSVDQKHTIIVGPAGWNGYNNLKFMPQYEDDNLIYTFHFYSPFVFTHQGSRWTDPSLEPLVGVPFPYDAARMPDCPPELENTWICSNLADYRNIGTPEYVRELIDIAADFKTARDVPLFCGEFGASVLSSNEDRIYWFSVVRSYFEQKGIAWTMWDYKSGSGLFEQGTSELFDYDLNIPLVEALGFNVPPQQEFILVPDVSEFDIYMDHIAPNITESTWIDEGLLDFYSEDNPASGDYCIHWTGVNQYNKIKLRFDPVKDLSVLVDTGFAVDFWVRCNSPGARFDIRFVDTKTDDPGDHPWHMIHAIDQNVAVWDGRWNHVQVPLNEFSEQGLAIDDIWFNPVGDFDWTATRSFEIVSEYGDLKGIHFYFDDIRVVDPNPPGRP